MVVGKNTERLIALLKKAIDDHVITGAEYEEIIELVHEDSVIDNHERRLLAELQEMIANRSIRRMP